MLGGLIACPWQCVPPPLLLLLLPLPDAAGPPSPLCDSPHRTEGASGFTSPPRALPPCRLKLALGAGAAPTLSQTRRRTTLWCDPRHFRAPRHSARARVREISKFLCPRRPHSVGPPQICPLAPDPTATVSCVHLALGCGFRGPRFGMRDHLAVCPFEPVKEVPTRPPPGARALCSCEPVSGRCRQSCPSPSSSSLFLIVAVKRLLVSPQVVRGHLKENTALKQALEAVGPPPPRPHLRESRNSMKGPRTLSTAAFGSYR